MTVSSRFVIIDDDAFNNKICSVTIEKISKEADVVTFLDPIQGFNYIAKTFDSDKERNAILFLDINMPVMNGWEFLERYETLADTVKSRIRVYILSSSVDKRDIERARTNKNVVHYLVKPLTRETIKQVMEGQSI